MSHSIRTLKKKYQKHPKIEFQYYITNPGEPDDYIKYDNGEENNTKLLKTADKYYWITKRQIKVTAQRLRMNPS